MPQITEIMDTSNHPSAMNDSTESSLQVSSSSADGVPSRALQVQTVATVPSRSESSSRSRQTHGTPELARRSRLEDSPYDPISRRVSASRSRSGSTSHHSRRGPGSVTTGGGLPSGLSVDQRSVHQHLHQHMHDQRSMQVQVGVDPEAVVQLLQGSSQTVIKARSEISNTQRLADKAVQNIVHEARSHVTEAQAQAQSVEARAQVYMNELNAKHQKELEEVQRVAQAQRAHDEYQVSQHHLN